jgi:hypothetical protein
MILSRHRPITLPLLLRYRFPVTVTHSGTTIPRRLSPFLNGDVR